MADYRAANRLHPCADGDTALDSVFEHWAAARADGQDALMLARTRLDVDALNLRARAAAVTADEVTGPVTVAGGRHWQAGDVLRARRNDRRLKVGDGHVRNGDRYQVLGPGPDGGLIVEVLTGRGRIVLPAAYLAEHTEYGWASTIDAAQGATADLGIVLVRPGMDREHLYVAMTRGRDGNHAYVTPDPTTDDDLGHGHHQRPAAVADDPQELAERVLAAALGRSGAQDAAHTALEHARTRAQAAQNQRAAEHAAERAAERAAAREAATKERQHYQARQARPLLPEHARVVQQLYERQAEREQFRTDLAALHGALRQNRAELEGLPRWARGRRRALTDTISSHELQLRQTEPTLAGLDAEIDRLSRQVTHHARQRHASDMTGPHRDRPGSWDLGRTGELTRPWPAPAGDDLAATGLPGRREPYRGAERDLDGGLSR